MAQRDRDKKSRVKRRIELGREHAKAAEQCSDEELRKTHMEASKHHLKRAWDEIVSAIEDRFRGLT